MVRPLIRGVNAQKYTVRPSRMLTGATNGEHEIQDGQCFFRLWVNRSRRGILCPTAHPHPERSQSYGCEARLEQSITHVTILVQQECVKILAYDSA